MNKHEHADDWKSLLIFSITERLSNFLLAFSVYTNGKKLLNTQQRAGALTSINGIRFISMSWVILGHTLAFIGPIAGKNGDLFFIITTFCFVKGLKIW